MKRIALILTLLTQGLTFGQVNLSSSLTACYALDASAAEPINNLTGTLSVVTPTVNRFNTANTAYYFNGTNSSYIQLPNSPLLKPNEITFSAWVKADALNGTMDVVFAKNTFSSFFSAYSLGVLNTGPNYKFTLYRQNGSGDNFINSISSVNVNTWYHIAFSLNSTAMKMYVNGVLEASMVPTILNFNYDPTRYVILGGTNESFNNPWNGTIDNARFYNRILNGSEVAALYSQDPSCNPLPVSSFSFSPPGLCAGGSIALTDLSTNNPNAWNWQISGATVSTSTASNTTATFQNPGTYIVSMTSSNIAGAGNTATQSIVVLPNPSVTIISNGFVCAGQNNTISSSGASTYTWSTNQTGPSIVVSPVGNITYTVIGTGTNGCVGSANISVTLIPVPVLNVSGSGTICQGLPTTLLVNGTAITYTWSNGTVGNLVTVTPSISTVYTVTGTNINGCTNTAIQLVFVNTLPAVMINVNNTSVCLGDAVVLNGSGAVSYSWTGGISDNIAFYPSTTNNYVVTGTGANGCKNTASVQIVVNPKPMLITSSSTSVNICPGEPVTLSVSGANIYSWSTGDVTPMVTVSPTITSSYTVTGTDANGCKAVFVFVQNVNACTGIQEANLTANVRIYPNPFNTELIVSNTNTGEIGIEVYNVLGEKILDKKSLSPTTSLTLYNEPNGIYFMKIFCGTKMVKLEKIIKTN